MCGAIVGGGGRVLRRGASLAWYDTEYYSLLAVTTPFFEFVWLAAFEDSARDLFGEEERHAVELELLDVPRKGEAIRGTGGVRKLRVRSGHRGKSGGARVIY